VKKISKFDAYQLLEGAKLACIHYNLLEIRFNT
jgi:hypothetical protein